MLKTNAARLLDAAGIQYELIPYDYTEEDLSAQHVAAELGEDIDRVFKTLVLRGDRTGFFVCVIPGDFEVDLKVAAPIGMKKPFPTYIHESALLYDFIYISAGQRGLQFKIAPQDLIDFVGAEMYPI